ncbi:hypothetical protein BDW66DRAFT_35052 [Aspergillus desertorum]
MPRKLQWEEIEKEFGQRFPGRDRKSLQGCWSRNLKFVNPSAKCLRTRGARNGALDGSQPITSQSEVVDTPGCMEDLSRIMWNLPHLSSDWI